MARFGRLRRGSTLTVAATTYLVPLVAIVTGPMIARALGQVRRGELALLLVWNEVGTGIFRLGVPDAVAYHDQRGLPRRSLWRSAVRVAMGSTPISVVSGLAVFLLTRQGNGLGIAVVSGLVVAWSPLVDTLGMTRLRLLVSSRDLRGLTLFNLVQPVWTLTLTVVLYLVGHLNLFTAAGVLILSQLAAYAFLYLRQSEVADEGESASEGSATPRTLLSFGLRTVPSAVGEIVNSRLDQLVMPMVLGLADLGVYAIAVSVAGLVTRVGYALSQTEYAKVGGAGSEMNQAASVSIRRSSIACVATGLMVAAAAPVLILVVFGDEFSGALVPCWILLIGTSLSGANLVATNVANVLGRPGVGSASQGVGLVITLVLLYPAMERFGVEGAAAVSMLAYAARYATTNLLLRRGGVPSMVPNRTDARWLLGRVRSMAGRPAGA